MCIRDSAYTAQEAVQWVYMAYLAAVKEQDGAEMSLGNVSSFLDIYMEYELSKGTITAVSYTHLDVYKRQEIRHRGRRNRVHTWCKILPT